MSDCQHRWYRNFMLINTLEVSQEDIPKGVGAEHLCIDCGKREWEVITPEEHKDRSSWQKVVFK